MADDDENTKRRLHTMAKNTKNTKTAPETTAQTTVSTITDVPSRDEQLAAARRLWVEQIASARAVTVADARGLGLIVRERRIKNGTEISGYDLTTPSGIRFGATSAVALQAIMDGMREVLGLSVPTAPVITPETTEQPLIGEVIGVIEGSPADIDRKVAKAPKAAKAAPSLDATKAAAEAKGRAAREAREAAKAAKVAKVA